MSVDTVSACVKVAACICGKDGVISQAEELAIFRIVSERFPEFCAEDFDRALTEFFESNEQIEDYLFLVCDEKLRVFTLRLSAESASADGLDIKENVALDKAYAIWGLRDHVSSS